MATGVITVDTTTNAIIIPQGPAKISFYGTFAGASIQIQENIVDTWNDILDGADVIGPYTAPNSFAYNLFGGDTIRLVATGTQPSTMIEFSVTSISIGSAEEPLQPSYITHNYNR